jgi:hypothetical protein
MFDGAAAVDAAQAASGDVHDAFADLHPVTATPARSSLGLPPASAPPSHASEVAFVDSTLPDAESLVAAIRPGVDIVWLDPETAPWTQMTQVLAERGKSDAVHIISRGNSGELIIGADSLLVRADQISGWADYLTSDADILLYGCDTANGSGGQRLVDTLASLTRADVAGSTDTTGNIENSGVQEETPPVTARQTPHKPTSSVTRHTARSIPLTETTALRTPLTTICISSFASIT